jgi:hypothetical protein
VADGSVLGISSSGLVDALSAGTSNVTASFGGLSVQQSISVKALADLSISPTSLTLAISSSQQLSVTGRYTDNSTEDFSGLVAWSSDNATIASISSTGEVNAKAAGSAFITASVNGISTDLNVVVSPATLQSIVVNSAATQVASGLSIQFSAKGVYSDGTEQVISKQVEWSVSDTSKAFIDTETGLLSALQAGSVFVLAKIEGKRGSFHLTISPATLSEISIVPATISLAKGTSANINVIAIFSDNSKQNVSDQVVWSNEDNSIAMIEQSSTIVKSLAKGTSIFTASLSGQSTNLVVNVSDAELVSLSISPVNSSIPLGLSEQFKAQGSYTDGSVQNLTSQVTWLSDTESVALISNAQDNEGMANSVAIGSSTISAVIGSVQQQTTFTVENAILTSIDIQPSNQTIAKGTDAEIAAYGYYSDGSQRDITSQVIWNSSNTSLVDLSSVTQGLVHSLEQGNVLLSAELQGLSGIANIEITSATLQSISIESAQASLANGMNQSLIARGVYSDASSKVITKQVTWQSSDTDVLSVSNNSGEFGLVRTRSVGQSIITASLGQVSGQISYEVTNAVLTGLQITSSVSELNVKNTIMVSAIATYSDSSTLNVTKQVNWTSANLNIISVGNDASNKGKITALSVGNTTISASLNGISSNTLPFVVSLNPNLPRALNLSAQPNIILNDNNDASQLTLALIPTGEGGVIADGTSVVLTITEGNNTRVENLVTTNGVVTYSLQSSYEGFISLSASSGNLSSSSGLLSTDDLSDAIARQGKASILYEDNTLRAGSRFAILLRNLSNRVFVIDKIDIFYLDPNNSNSVEFFPGMPLTDDDSTSNGDLIGGEFTFIGYELDYDVAASLYGIRYYFSDIASNTNFGLSAAFNFAQ